MPHIEITYNDLKFEPEVQKLCLNPKFKCPNYNNNWACPPEAPYLEEELARYKLFFLIFFRFDIKPYSHSLRKKHPKWTHQRILNRVYSKRLTESGLEMEIFRFLDNYEGNFSENKVLWGGHCNFCYLKLKKGCSKSDNESCRFPDDRRYSMEAVGINVDKTVRNLGFDLEWPPKKHLFRFGLMCFK